MGGRSPRFCEKVQLEPLRHELGLRQLAVKLRDDRPHLVEAPPEEIICPLGVEQVAQLGGGIALHGLVGQRQHTLQRHGVEAALLHGAPRDLLEHRVHKMP